MTRPLPPTSKNSISTQSTKISSNTGRQKSTEPSSTRRFDLSWGCQIIFPPLAPKWSSLKEKRLTKSEDINTRISELVTNGVCSELLNNLEPANYL